MRNFLVVCLIFLFSGGAAHAKNPDVSFWMENLSESDAVDAPGYTDNSPEIFVEGNTVHVMWITAAEDEEKKSVYQVNYCRSLDNGTTWEPHVTVFSSYDLYDSKTQKNLVVEGNYVHIAVSDSIGDEWHGRLIYIRSTDNGASFEDPRVLDEAPNYNHLYDVHIIEEDGRVSIAYRFFKPKVMPDPEKSISHIMTSDDHGETFTNEYTSPGYSGSHTRSIVDFQCSGDNLYMLSWYGSYYYGLNFGKLELTVVSDDGTSYTTTVSVPTRDETIHMVAGAQQNGNHVPKMAINGNTVSVIWGGHDKEKNINTVFYRRSTDNGQTFEDPISLVTGVLAEKSVDYYSSTIAARGDYVYVTFSCKSKIYLCRSDNGGTGFYDPQEVTNTSYGGPTSGVYPVLALDPQDDSGQTLHVMWTKPAYCFTADGGNTFSNPVFVWPQWTGSSSFSTIQLALGADGKRHFVTDDHNWVDDFIDIDDVDEDILYRGLADPPEPTGNQKALRLKSIPYQRYDNMQVADSPDFHFTSKMTAEVWVQSSADEENFTKPVFSKLMPDNSFQNAFALTLTGSKSRPKVTKVRGEITTTDGNYYIEPGSIWGDIGVIEDNKWTHLALTYDAEGGEDNLKLYVNGELLLEKTVTGELVFCAAPLLVGVSSVIRYGNYDIDELRFWNVVRTPQQISQTMNQELTGKEEGLVAYYNFNDTVKDITGRGNDGILMYKETYVPSLDLKQVENKHIYILTDAVPDADIGAGETAMVYGTAHGNRISVQPGAKVSLYNMIGANTVEMHESRVHFSVSRSGAAVTLKNHNNGTQVKIPATKEPQSIIFNDATLTLIINNGKAMLDQQEVTTDESPLLLSL